MLHQWIIPDTAPPLYPVLLRLWIGIAGDNEIATRAFSLACAGLSLTCLAAYTWRASLASYYVSIVYLGTLPAFSRYAQEVRNYALILLLATIALISFLISLQPSAHGQQKDDNARLAFHVSLVLLSLTSYFALVYACILLLTQVLLPSIRSATTRQHDGVNAIITLGIMLTWPAFHFFILGDLQSSAQRFNWNQVTPVLGTLNNLGIALLPAALDSSWLFMLSLVALAFLVHQQLQTGRPRIMLPCCVLALNLTAFVAVVMVIDLFFPFSTDRNFIVLVPCACLLLATGSTGLQWHNKGTLIALGLGVILAIQEYNLAANNLLFGKIVPYQNYKRISEALATSGLCHRYTCRLSERIPAHAQQTYFADLMIHPGSQGKPSALPQPYPDQDLITIGTAADQVEIRPRDSLHPSAKPGSQQCFEPRQAWRGSAVLIAPEIITNELAAQQIFPCKHQP